MESCNHSMAIEYGYKCKEDIKGVSVYDIFMKDDDLLRSVWIELDKANYRVKNLETVEIDQNGKPICLINNSVPIIKDNYLFSLQGTSVNITKKMKMQADLKKANDSKEMFISILAHDLRSPFNCLLGFSELLVQYIEKKEYENIYEISKLIRESTSNTFNLLENLLIWAKTIQNKFPFNPSFHNLKEIVLDAYSNHKQSAAQKNINVEIQIDKKVNIFADKNMIETVIRNLISNAVKFTLVNGEIKIIGVAYQDKVKISISDTGNGMSQQQINKLFMVEHMDSSPGTEGEKGSGLGLVICKEFIDRNNGQIFVESEIGRGSIFEIVLPKNTQIH